MPQLLPDDRACDDLELITVQCSLCLHSETGDHVQASSEQFRHNQATDADVLAAFDAQAASLRRTLEAFLMRRGARRWRRENEGAA